MTPERKNGDPMKHLLDKRSKQNFLSNSVFFFQLDHIYLSSIILNDTRF